VPWRPGGLFSTVFHAAGSGTAGTSTFPSQSRLADLSRISTFSHNIWHPRLRTCSCPFTVVDFFKVDHRSARVLSHIVCAMDVAVHLESQKMEQTRLHVPAGRLSLHTPGAHSTRATPCAWPMSRLAPCDRGALDAPGSESTQCLIARVAHMYLTSQLPPQVIKKCPHNNVLLPTSYRPFRFQENHHQSFPQFFASAIQLSLYNLTDTLLLALQQQQKITLP
jgi:hypothetical protein